MADADLEKTLAVFSLAGFGVQQSLQLADPLISGLAKLLAAFGPLRGCGADAASVKKWLMATAAVGVSAFVAHHVEPLRLLKLIGADQTRWDVAVTALVLGAGSEGTNTLLKYVGYVKEARKAALVEVSIHPANVTVAPGGTVAFSAAVSGSSAADVEWYVVQGSAGGTVDAAGQYVAPPTPGTYTVAARSVADSRKFAFASVKVG